jgi:hypothetical protein
LKTVERHFGTVGAGVFVILLGLAGVGRAAWVIRPVFRNDNLCYKVGGAEHQDHGEADPVAAQLGAGLGGSAPPGR